MKTLTRILAAGALALAAFASPGAYADDKPRVGPYGDPVTSDNLLWYRIQPLSHDPYVNDPKTGRPKDIVKHMVHFEHSDTGGFIWNSWTVTALFADSNEPNNTRTGGASELYSTYRGDISATGFGYAPISFPGVRDLQFEFGGDINWKNDDYQARRKFLVAGPIFVIDLPGNGSLTWAWHVAHEFNHNGITHQYTRYHPTWNSEVSWTQYLDDDRLFRIEGVFNITGPKGKDTKLSKTVTEYYFYNSFVLDAGQLFKMAPHQLDVFAGLQYWIHKFGYPTNNNPGALEFTPYIGVGIHF